MIVHLSSAPIYTIRCMSDESYDDRDERADRSWIPDDALSSIVSEHQLHPEEDEEALARRLLRESLPQVTLGLIHTAIHGGTDRTRLDAQKYLMDRVLGRPGDDAFGATNPVDDLIEDVTKYIEAQQ